SSVDVFKASDLTSSTADVKSKLTADEVSANKTATELFDAQGKNVTDVISFNVQDQTGTGVHNEVSHYTYTNNILSQIDVFKGSQASDETSANKTATEIFDAQGKNVTDVVSYNV